MRSTTRCYAQCGKKATKTIDMPGFAYHLCDECFELHKTLNIAQVKIARKNSRDLKKSS